jgi:hypothetical protein
MAWEAFSPWPVVYVMIQGVDVVFFVQNRTGGFDNSVLCWGSVDDDDHVIATGLNSSQSHQ